ncbi:hypothetical protein Tco_0153069 [Tanacetum coccineum]
MMHTDRGDGVASIKRRRRDLSSNGVEDLTTASGRNRLKLDLEDSTWLTEPQGMHLGYISFTSPSREKRQNGLIKRPPPKSRHGISSSRDFLIISFQQDAPLPLETGSSNSNQGSTNPSKAPGSDNRIKLDQFTHFRFSSLTEEEGWNRIEEYVQYQDDLWDDPLPPVNVSLISGIIQPTFKGRLKMACKRISYLEIPAHKVGLKNPYLICDYCGGSHEAEECSQNFPVEQVCLSRGDIYDNPSLLRFYQNDDILPWGNIKRKEKGEDGPKWVVRSKFEDKLVNFMLEKKFHAEGIREMLDQHHKEMHE